MQSKVFHICLYSSSSIVVDSPLYRHLLRLSLSVCLFLGPCPSMYFKALALVVLHALPDRFAWAHGRSSSMLGQKCTHGVCRGYFMYLNFKFATSRRLLWSQRGLLTFNFMAYAMVTYLPYVVTSRRMLWSQLVLLSCTSQRMLWSRFSMLGLHGVCCGHNAGCTHGVCCGYSSPSFFGAFALGWTSWRMLWLPSIACIIYSWRTLWYLLAIALVAPPGVCRGLHRMPHGFTVAVRLSSFHTHSSCCGIPPCNRFDCTPWCMPWSTAAFLASCHSFESLELSLIALECPLDRVSGSTSCKGDWLTRPVSVASTI